MTVALVQNLTASAIYGDAQGGNEANTSGFQLAWPTMPTSGNLLVAAVAADNSGAPNPQTTPSGWTRAGSIVTSPDYAGNTLAVYYKTAGVSESLLFPLSSTDSWGGRSAGTLLEWSGTTGFDKVATVATSGASLTLTTAPSVSVTPTLAGSLVMWFGACFDHHGDGTQKLTGVSLSGSVTTIGIAPSNGERLGAGDGPNYEYSVSHWAGYKLNAAASAQSSAPTWTWTGGGTTIPQGGAAQMAVVFKG